MPLATIICESACLLDLGNSTLPGFELHQFDMSPATHSASSLWLMQSDEPVPPGPVYGPNLFAENRGFISQRVRSRIVGHYWPQRFNPAAWDNEIMPNRMWYNVIDEPNEEWARTCSLARTLGQGDVQWLIYWPTLGHEKHRLDHENKGIPATIHNTLAKWLGLIESDFLIEAPPWLPILIHPDHGTARSSGNGFIEGFVFSRNVVLPARCTWADIRDAERQCLGL